MVCELRKQCKYAVYKTSHFLKTYSDLLEGTKSTLETLKVDETEAEDVEDGVCDKPRGEVDNCKKKAELKIASYCQLKQRWEKLLVRVEVDAKRVEQQKANRTLQLISMWQQIINYCLYIISVLSIFITGIGITHL